LVVNNLTFQKPFLPEQVAKNINLEPDKPLMLVVKYDNYQDVASGLSFALALEKIRYPKITNKLTNQLNHDSLAFVYKSPDLSTLNNNINQTAIPKSSQFNLWFVGSSMRKQDFATQLAIPGQFNCYIDPDYHYRTGPYPYQLYRCVNR
jgi:hypothetical protein